MKHIPTFESFVNENLNEGAFFRLPKDKKTGDDFYIAKKNIEQLYDAYVAGQDFNDKWFDETLKHLENVKKAAKKFNSPDELEGTVYEAYKLIEPKLNAEEKQYLKSISRTPFMNEEILNEGTIVSDLIKMFGDAKEWGPEMKDRVYAKGNNLVFVDSFYYGGDAALESLKKSWLPGGNYYEYFIKELKLKPTIVFAFSEMKAVGRHKKFTDNGVVGVELSFEK